MKIFFFLFFYSKLRPFDRSSFDRSGFTCCLLDMRYRIWIWRRGCLLILVGRLSQRTLPRVANFLRMTPEYDHPRGAPQALSLVHRPSTHTSRGECWKAALFFIQIPHRGRTESSLLFCLPATFRVIPIAKYPKCGLYTVSSLSLLEVAVYASNPREKRRKIVGY